MQVITRALRGQSPPSPTWALGYLNGRAQAFRNGNLTLANVTAAVRLALRYDVQPDSITATLRMVKLTWDAQTGIVTTCRPAPVIK